MRTYNGFTNKERLAGGAAQRRAATKGVFAFPRACSVCGFTVVEQTNKKSRFVIAHLEDYRRPLECLPCCRRCHFAVHRRFSRPERWLELVERFWRKGAWFTKLSMDPTLQTRPYDEIYPEGLFTSTYQEASASDLSPATLP